ncbi:hypothetical protein CDL12_13861 [Handroanthus impetiginosus]|uniref:BZIP domain-containing protein n=1 Tax=Handroanthus impetiginosus TaxID=429701 RepID=A0A2G9H7R3_9LAMI|nr:hypothetical protein CDL12_13861 [Handroanthus impetiginosus]
MASSKVMASRSPPNADHPRQSSPSRLSLHSDRSRGLGSMNIDDILRNIYSDPGSFSLENSGGVREGNRDKAAEEVWRDMVGDLAGGRTELPMMTLEDYLANAGVVNKEDVRVPPAVTMPPPPAGAFGMEPAMVNPATGVPAVQFAPVVGAQSGIGTGGFGVDFENGRGKRRAAVDEMPLDKATQQKRRRMIKNRESAARSRERKQAYTVELEASVTRLEEENARLWKEEAEMDKKRYKQLMENLIPVVEKRRPPRALRRVTSMQW